MRSFEFRSSDDSTDVYTAEDLRSEIARTQDSPTNRVELLTFLLTLDPEDVVHLSSLRDDNDLWITISDDETD